MVLPYCSQDLIRAAALPWLMLRCCRHGAEGVRGCCDAVRREVAFHLAEARGERRPLLHSGRQVGRGARARVRGRATW